MRPEEIADAVISLQSLDGRLQIGIGEIEHSFENEWCFFFKPSITRAAARSALTDSIRLALDLFDYHDMAIIEAHAISPNYMRNHRLAAKNYRELVEIAMHASARINDSRVLRYYSDVDQILGGYEALARHGLDVCELDRLWYSARQFRLGRAATGAVVSMMGSRVLLVNGFVPSQIESYGQPGTVTIALRLAANLDWSTARHLLLGTSNPIEAAPGSIRHELWVRRKRIGLPRIDLNRNGVHLSAGPLDAAQELQLLMSDDQDHLRPLSDFSFGRRLVNSCILRNNVHLLVPSYLPGSHPNECITELYVQARTAVENQNETEAIALLEQIVRFVERPPESGSRR